MGGNASSGLWGEVHHGLWDMSFMGTNDRPTKGNEDTNRKSLFPVPKTPDTPTKKSASALLNRRLSSGDWGSSVTSSVRTPTRTIHVPSMLASMTRRWSGDDLEVVFVKRVCNAIFRFTTPCYILKSQNHKVENEMYVFSSKILGGRTRKLQNHDSCSNERGVCLLSLNKYLG